MKKILRAKGGSPCLKKKCIAKLIEIKGVKQFTFRQQHASAFMQRRLNHFFYLCLHQMSDRLITISGNSRFLETQQFFLEKQT